jgi:hypothetical protein
MKSAWPAHDLTRAARFEAVRVRASRPLWWIGGVGIIAHSVISAAVAAYLAYDPMVKVPYSGPDVARLVVISPPVLALAAGLIGLLIGGSDYRHNAIGLTCRVSPRRGAVLGGKAAVVAAAAVSVALAGAVVSMSLLEAMYVPARHQSIGAGVVAGAVLALVAKVVLWAVIGMLLAIATRSQTVAGVALIVFSSVLEPAARSVAAVTAHGWWTGFPQLLPFTAIDGTTALAVSGDGRVFSSTGLPAGWSLFIALGWVAFLALAAVGSLRPDRSTAVGERTPAPA